MTISLNSAVLVGVNCEPVKVEVALFRGMAEFSIVGLGGTAIQEAKKRIYSAIKNSGFEYPSTKKIVNLSPANLRKHGAYYDLPIALGILAASNQICDKWLADSIFIGELGLNGKVKPVPGALAIADHATKSGYKRLFAPAANTEELSLVKGIEIIPINCLKSGVKILNGDLPKFNKVDKLMPIAGVSKNKLNEIIGQSAAKRATFIAAAGGHNLLMIGSPGVGKTLIGESLASILPELNYAEIFELTKIYSLFGKNSKLPIVTKRPFRTISSNCSIQSLIGGGIHLRPGEITLAHKGVLFIDELLEFPRKFLDLLRQPIEQKQIKLSSRGYNTTYPANFTLVAATNPCPCGYYFEPEIGCKCTPYQVNRYQSRLSGPMKDRFALTVKMMRSKQLEDSLYSEKIDYAKFVKLARKRQLARNNYQEIKLNNRLTNSELKKYCQMSSAAIKMLNLAQEKLMLSTRGIIKIKKVALTIADLSDESTVKEAHILEALGYRLKW